MNDKHQKLLEVVETIYSKADNFLRAAGGYTDDVFRYEAYKLVVQTIAEIEEGFGLKK